MTADTKRAGQEGGEAVYTWHPKIACRTLDGTSFVLLGSRMLSLNSVGSRIWDLFESGATVAEVADAISAEFDTTRETATADTQGFVETLLSRQLLVPHALENPSGHDSAQGGNTR